MSSINARRVSTTPHEAMTHKPSRKLPTTTNVSRDTHNSDRNDINEHQQSLNPNDQREPSRTDELCCIRGRTRSLGTSTRGSGNRRPRPGEWPGEASSRIEAANVRSVEHSQASSHGERIGGLRRRHQSHDMSTAAIAARRALQQQRARVLYRGALRNVLSYAVHRDIFYVEVLVIRIYRYRYRYLVIVSFSLRSCHPISTSASLFCLQPSR